MSINKQKSSILINKTNNPRTEILKEKQKRWGSWLEVSLGFIKRRNKKTWQTVSENEKREHQKKKNEMDECRNKTSKSFGSFKEAAIASIAASTVMCPLLTWYWDAQIPSSTIRKRREKRRLQWAGEPLSLSTVLSLSNCCCCGSCTAITNVCAFALHDEFLVRIVFYFLFKYHVFLT